VSLIDYELQNLCAEKTLVNESIVCCIVSSRGRPTPVSCRWQPRPGTASVERCFRADEGHGERQRTLFTSVNVDVDAARTRWRKRARVCVVSLCVAVIYVLLKLVFIYIAPRRVRCLRKSILYLGSLSTRYVVLKAR